MRNITVTAILIVFALAAGFGIFVSAKVLKERGTGAPQVGGAFTLTNQNGQPFTEKNLLGKYSLVFFGFTACPDICPTTLTTITQVMEGLGNRRAALLPVFISVDSTGDTPATMKTYLSNFHPSITGLTGTEEQIKTVTTAYKAYYAKVKQPESSTGYTMDHSAYLYLMDKNGHYVTHFSHDDTAEKIITTIKPYLE